jgi:hypothetical protein
VRGVKSPLKGQGDSDHNKPVKAGGPVDVVYRDSPAVWPLARLYQKSSHRLEFSDRMDRYRSCWVLALGGVY